jgi:hypothetical protein
MDVMVHGPFSQALFRAFVPPDSTAVYPRQPTSAVLL